MNQEDVFAEEAQEEAATSEQERIQSPSRGKFQVRTSEEYLSDNDNENSPLLSVPASPSNRRVPLHKRGHSYQRALDEPWTGAHGVGPLPWYKRPSVRILIHVR